MNTNETANTNENANITVGNGTAVHASQYSEWAKGLVPMCNGWAGTNGGSRTARITKTDREVTCKKCQNIDIDIARAKQADKLAEAAKSAQRFLAASSES